MVTLLAIFAENNDDIWICVAQQHIAGVSFTDSGIITVHIQTISLHIKINQMTNHL